MLELFEILLLLDLVRDQLWGIVIGGLVGDLLFWIKSYRLQESLMEDLVGGLMFRFLGIVFVGQQEIKSRVNGGIMSFDCQALGFVFFKRGV